MTSHIRASFIFLLLITALRGNETGVIVTTGADEDDGFLGNGAGVSLREALNHSPAGSLITFAPALSGETISLRNGATTLGALMIAKPVVIDASALSGGIIIDGGSNGDFTVDPGETRCMIISDGDDTIDFAVTLLNLTVRNGAYDTQTAVAGAGANIHNRENLIMRSCRITGARLSGGPVTGVLGGGIFSEGGSLEIHASEISGNASIAPRGSGGGIATRSPTTLTDCLIGDNRALAGGGGVWVSAGTISLTRCRITGNSTTGEFANGGGMECNSAEVNLSGCEISGNSTAGDEAEGGGVLGIASSITMTGCNVIDNFTSGRSGDGGGVFLFGGNFSMTGCTVARNRTAGTAAHGAGIFVDTRNSTAAAHITRSTISGNVGANASAGGLRNNRGHLDIVHCTIIGNRSAVYPGLGSSVDGLAKTYLTGSIVRDNIGTGPQIGGYSTTIPVSKHKDSHFSLGGNLVGSTDAFSVGFAATEIDPSTPVLLAPLGDYGGKTLTVPPFPGSPVIGRAGGMATATDQRGLPVDAIADTGAAEFQGNADSIRFWKLDPDGDGSPLGVEQALGTAGFAADSSNLRNPVLRQDPSGRPCLTFGRSAEAIPGTVWRVTRSPDLSDGGFVEIFRFDGISTIPASPDPQLDFSIGVDYLSVTDLAPPDGKAFYRFEAIPPQ